MEVWTASRPSSNLCNDTMEPLSLCLLVCACVFVHAILKFYCCRSLQRYTGSFPFSVDLLIHGVFYNFQTWWHLIPIFPLVFITLHIHTFSVRVLRVLAQNGCLTVNRFRTRWFISFVVLGPRVRSCVCYLMINSEEDCKKQTCLEKVRGKNIKCVYLYEQMCALMQCECASLLLLCSSMFVHSIFVCVCVCVFTCLCVHSCCRKKIYHLNL